MCPSFNKLLIIDIKIKNMENEYENMNMVNTKINIINSLNDLTNYNNISVEDKGRIISNISVLINDITNLIN